MPPSLVTSLPPLDEQPASSGVTRVVPWLSCALHPRVCLAMRRDAIARLGQVSPLPSRPYVPVPSRPSTPFLKPRPLSSSLPLSPQRPPIPSPSLPYLLAFSLRLSIFSSPPVQSLPLPFHPLPFSFRPPTVRSLPISSRSPLPPPSLPSEDPCRTGWI